jgi:hypothetical protein
MGWKDVVTGPVARRAAEKKKQGTKPAEQPLAPLKGAYTIKKICIECGAVRMCKPQDAWQVKRCIPCQEAKRGTKLKALVEKKASPAGQADESKKRRLAKLQAWVDRTEIEVEYVRRMQEQEKHEKPAKKPRKVWP